MMKSTRFRILLEFIEKTNSTIFLPRIAFQELIEIYRRNLKNMVEDWYKVGERVNQHLLSGEMPNTELNIDHNVRLYEDYILNKLNLFNTQKSEYDSTHLNEIVRRSVKRIKPISVKGQEFRDALLWLTLLDHAKENRNEDVVFISNNIRDFGNEGGTDFHIELKNELAEKNIKIDYFKTLGEFVNEKAVKIDFLSREWLIKNLNWAELDHTAFEKGAVEYTLSDRDYLDILIYENGIDHENFIGWPIKSASFKREIPMYFVHEINHGNKYFVELNLDGIGKVELVKNDNSSILLNFEFYTSVTLDVLDEKIVDCQAHFYREESGIVLKRKL